MKTKSLSIFLVALFVVEMNLGTEEGNNEKKEDENFKYEKINMVNLDTSNFSLKMVLIGGSNVGKSVLIRKICKNKPFSEEYSPTVGFEYLVLYFKIVSDNDEPVLRCQIWDCCGQEEYKCLIDNFYGNARVFLLAYDVTNDESFKNIEKWVNDVKAKNTDKTIHFVLIGTKIDLNDNRKVPKEDGEKFAKENGMAFVEVSAKTDAGREDLEDILAKIIYEEFMKYKKEKEEEEEKKEEEDEKKEEEDEKKEEEDEKKEEEEIIKKDDSEDDSIVGEEHTHSSSLCDCCKEICDNC